MRLPRSALHFLCAVLLLAAGLGLSLTLFRNRPSASGREGVRGKESGLPQPGRKGAVSARPPAPPAEPSGGARQLLEELAAAVGGNDRAALLASARALRAALAKDPALLSAAAAVLRDAEAPADLREAVATVLGSLPGAAGKRAILEGLRSGALQGIERVAVLALGISEAEDGEAFERDGQPRAVELASGLTVFVSGPLSDPEARAEAAARLGASESAEERLAAAMVLRDSTGFTETRAALLGVIEGEGGLEGDGRNEVTAEAATALAEWTRGVEVGDGERAAVVARLFDVVPDSEEVVRFRLTAPLSSTPLSPEEAERLAALAAAPQDDSRRFAIEVLGRQIDPRNPAGDSRLAILTNAAVSDASAEVREAAAVALGRVTMDRGAVEALIQALRQDPDWEVRSAAARSLAPSAVEEAARAALTAAASADPMPEVRAAAEESLSAGVEQR